MKKNFFFTVLTFAIIFGVLDLGIRFLYSPGPLQGKRWISDNKFTYYVLCYSSPTLGGMSKNSSEIPFIQQNWEEYRHQLQGNWWCISHDVQARVTGYYPDREKTVFIGGDSFAFGEGTVETETLSYLLDQRFSKVNFRNVAKPGMNLSWATDRIRYYISNIDKPDILYIYNLNDIEPIEKPGSHFGAFDFQNVNQVAYTFGFFQSGLLGLLNSSWIQFSSTWKTVNDYQDFYFADKFKENRDHHKKNFFKLIQDVKSRGGNFKLVVYPLLYRNLFGVYPFNSIHQEVLKWCEEWKVECVDMGFLHDSLPSIKESIIHPIDYHPNGRTQAIFVDLLSRDPVLNYLK